LRPVLFVVGRVYLEVNELHGYDLSPSEARELQSGLSPRIKTEPSIDLDAVRFVAGADVSTEAGTNMAYATVVVLEFPGLSVAEERGFSAPLEFPYVPGLLSFRELPSVVGALREVESPVDVLVCDAHGTAHPRRLGLASHVGLFLDVPTIGCAKTKLVGEFEEPGEEKGSTSELVDRGDVTPVYVSVGNGISLESSVELVLSCSPQYRLPETTRKAHEAANRLRRGEADTLF
jgi:deoxyribonuclease V